MSANFTIRNGVMAAMGVSGLLLSACASNGHHKSYPGEVYAYESGKSNCGVVETHQPVTVSPRYSSGCATTAVVAPPAPAIPDVVYSNCGTTTTPECTPDVVYADCGTITNMGCDYNAYESGGSHSGTTYSGSTGTTYSGSTGYSSGTTYGSTASTTYTPSTTTTYSSGSVECPAGTTLQPDNTCLQSGSSSYTSGGMSSHSSSTTTSTYSQPVTCPAGTVMQGDGSCMSTGYSSSTSYTADDYLPIRK